jgi:DNA transformation protein
MVGMNHRSDSDFVHFVVESLQPLGPVTAKRMFGGHGLFLDKSMFAVVVFDTLYFKVDEINRPEYEARGLEPFSYTGQNGRPMQMSYHEAPPEGVDDPELLLPFARAAFAAALRAKAALPKKPAARSGPYKKDGDRTKGRGAPKTAVG